MIYRARTEANEMFIAMYETEEPKKTILHDGTISEVALKKHYEERYKKWQSSKREYKVMDWYKFDVKVLLQKSYFESMPKGSYLNVESAMEKGLDCTFLKDRLELKTVWKRNTGRSVPTKEDLVEYWTLLPLEDKKETTIDVNLNRALIAHDLECEIGKEFNLTNKQYKAIIDYVSAEAVEFAEWLAEKHYRMVDINITGGYWKNEHPRLFKTYDLYQLFKNPNKQ